MPYSSSALPARNAHRDHEIPDYKGTNGQPSNKFSVFAWSMVAPNEATETQERFNGHIDRNDNTTDHTIGSLNTPQYDFDVKELQKLLVRMDRFLRTDKSIGRVVRHSYRRGRSHTWEEVVALLGKKAEQAEIESSLAHSMAKGHSAEEAAGNKETQETQIPFSKYSRSLDFNLPSEQPASPDTASSKQEPSRKANRKSKAPSRSDGQKLVQQAGRLVFSAKTFLLFFVPLETTSEMVTKYWGAIFCLIEVKDLAQSGYRPTANTPG